MQYILTKRDMCLTIVQAIYLERDRERIFTRPQLRKHYSKLMRNKKENLKSGYEIAMMTIREKMI